VRKLAHHHHDRPHAVRSHAASNSHRNLVLDRNLLPAAAITLGNLLLGYALLVAAGTVPTSLTAAFAVDISGMVNF
jgi:hypothetical protein